MLSTTLALFGALSPLIGETPIINPINCANNQDAVPHNIEREVLSVKREVDRTSTRPKADRFTPHQAPINWYAIGDSYTAGPGAGEDYDSDKKCKRNRGSYAVQLESDFPFTSTNDLDFVACSGYVATDTLNKTVPALRQNWADFMVMTLGGNDIKFSEIAIDCLVRPGLISRSCDETISIAQKAIAAPKLENDIHAVYDAAFAKMKDDRHYQLYHIFYSRFFNAETSWCDTKSFETPLSRNPPLTRAVRKQLNDLSDQLNARLEGIVSSYNQLLQSKPSWSSGPRLIGINPDKIQRSDGSTYALFDGHRFCEPGATEVENDNVWIFGTLDDDALQNYSPREYFDLPEKVSSSFHPKTAGFRAIKGAVKEALVKNRAG